MCIWIKFILIVFLNIHMHAILCDFHVFHFRSYSQVNDQVLPLNWRGDYTWDTGSGSWINVIIFNKEFSKIKKFLVDNTLLDQKNKIKSMHGQIKRIMKRIMKVIAISFRPYPCVRRVNWVSKLMLLIARMKQLIKWLYNVDDWTELRKARLDFQEKA